MGNPVPKTNTFRSAKYRIFVEQHPCGRCNRPVVPDEKGRMSYAHHARIGLDEGGWGIKISDLRCVPRCWACHVPIEHQHPTPVNDLMREQILLMSEYIEKLEGNCGKDLRG